MLGSPFEYIKKYLPQPLAAPWWDPKLAPAGRSMRTIVSIFVSQLVTSQDSMSGNARTSRLDHILFYGRVGMRRSNLVHHFTERADLPGESLPSQTILEIYGENRILIENHQGVTEYSDQQIGVRVHYGSVCVSGSGLHLCRITGCQLVIAGRIEQVKLVRR